MTINSAFNWLLVGQLILIAATLVLAILLDTSSFETELADFAARHGEIYDADPDAIMAVGAVALALCIPTSLYGLWRRRRWGAYLYVFGAVLALLFVLAIPDTIYVSDKTDYFFESIWGTLDGFIIASILLRRTDLGFPPLFRQKATG